MSKRLFFCTTLLLFVVISQSQFRDDTDDVKEERDELESPSMGHDFAMLHRGHDQGDRHHGRWHGRQEHHDREHGKGWHHGHRSHGKGKDPRGHHGKRDFHGKQGFDNGGHSQNDMISNEVEEDISQEGKSNGWVIGAVGGGLVGICIVAVLFAIHRRRMRQDLEIQPHSL
jgi:hypothetical protein